MFLNPAFSQNQQGNAGIRSKVLAESRNKRYLQVTLASDITATRPANAAPVESSDAGQQISGEPGPGGGDRASDNPAASTEERASPSKESLAVPLLVSATTYYRSDELDKRPQITRQIEPEFPLSVNPGIKGVVVARLFISEEGLVEQVQIVSAQPPGLFEDAVMKAFEGARYLPGMRGGKPVRAQLTLAIDFASEVPNQ